MSSLSRWFILFGCTLLLLSDIAAPKLANTIYFISILGCCFCTLFFIALYFFKKTTSGIIYSWPFYALIIVKVSSWLIILYAGLQFYCSLLSLSISSNHLFISPAITINYHFFYKEFIYITDRNAYNLLSSVGGSFAKSSFKNVLVI